MGGTPLSSDRSTRPSVGADETTGLRSAPTPTADAKRLDGGDDVTTANLLADWLARMSALASSRFFLFFCFTFLPFFFRFFFFQGEWKKEWQIDEEKEDGVAIDLTANHMIILDLNAFWFSRSSSLKWIKIETDRPLLSTHTHTSNHLIRNEFREFAKRPADLTLLCKWDERVRRLLIPDSPAGRKKRGRVSMRAQLTVDTNGKEKRSRNFKCQR